jgi:hypothetical protein
MHLRRPAPASRAPRSILPSSPGHVCTLLQAYYVRTGYELLALLVPSVGILQPPGGAGIGTNYGYARRCLHHGPHSLASTQVG